MKMKLKIMERWKVHKRRRKNPIAKELMDPKFKQRTVNPKKVYKRKKLDIKDVEQVDEDRFGLWPNIY